MIKRKGIILAAGEGTRLWPASVPVCKGLLPIYDKPMIYYPLTTLMLAGIKDILIITTPQDQERFRLLLGNGNLWGINLSYAVQKEADGIAQAFIIGEEFLNSSPSALILGDNIFYGAGFANLLDQNNYSEEGATVFAHYVNDPERFGVISFSEEGVPVEIQEKPLKYISNWALTGLYFYDESVVDIARTIKPSKRNELEITSVNQIYLEAKKLNVVRLGRGYAWLDAGTPESLLESSMFINSIEQRQGLKIGCPEEVAYRKGFISKEDLTELIENYSCGDYAKYLRTLLIKNY